jgi:transcriptional regulator with XRE-family HTH domain
MTDAEAQRLGRVIEAARRKQGLSYGELAALSETDKAWLHQLENGQRADPDPVLLTRVAEALGIDPAQRAARPRASQALAWAPSRAGAPATTSGCHRATRCRGW